MSSNIKAKNRFGVARSPLNKKPVMLRDSESVYIKKQRDAFASMTLSRGNQQK